MLGVLRLGMLEFNSPLPLCWMGFAERAAKLRPGDNCLHRRERGSLILILF